MTIATMDAFISALAGGYRRSFFKTGVTLASSPQLASFWMQGGVPGAPSSNPPTGAGEAPTSSTTGALPYTNASGGTTNYLLGFEAGAGFSCNIFLYDRLVHTSGLSGTSVAAQTVNSAAITRPDANGANAELFLEIYTTVGGTAATATISYTNQSGTAGQSATASIGGTGGTPNKNAGTLIPVQLSSGDTGVRSVQSVTLSGSTGTAGNFGITIGRRVAFLPLGNNSTGTTMATDAFDLGFPALVDSMCLWLVGFSGGSATPGPIAGIYQVGSN